MTDDSTFETDNAPPPVGAYPHARKVGNLLFLSGIGPRPVDGGLAPGVTLDDSGEVTSYDIEAQCHADSNCDRTKMYGGRGLNLRIGKCSLSWRSTSSNGSTNTGTCYSRRYAINRCSKKTISS